MVIVKENALFKNFLLVVIATTVLFALHRALAWPFLSGGIDSVSSQSLWAIVLVGLGSDLWISFLYGALFLLIGFLLRACGRNDDRALALIFIAVGGCAAAFHQPYVEFFRFQFMLYHLRYLADPDFLLSSRGEFLNPRMLFLLGATMIMMALYVFLEKQTWRTSGILAGMVILILVAPLAHSANIHYRVQLFVPMELQVNGLERLYLQAQVPSNPEDLTQAEKALLKSRLGSASIQPQVASPTLPVMQQLRSRWATLVAHHQQPLALVVVMESARYGDFGVPPDDSVSLTPAYDQLAEQGWLFERAYSTSNVTRGGQEAVWCGHVSSLATSMMRSRPDLHLRCLPQLAGSQARTLWLHGGRGAFDGQRQFWQQHMVQRFLAFEQFAPETPESDWGKTDRALVSQSLNVLDEEYAHLQQNYILGMLLTITNHIPWKLPRDTPESVHALIQQWPMQPTQQTTAYTDVALGELVEGLKKRGWWDKTLLVVVSDHGTAPVTWHEQHGGQALSEEERMSHINLLISGGITEHVVSAQPMTARRTTHVVSQAGIAPFLADLLGVEAMFYGEHILSERPRLPVVADFGPKVYLPQLAKALPRRAFLDHDETPANEDESFAIAYYRAFLLSLNQQASRNP